MMVKYLPLGKIANDKHVIIIYIDEDSEHIKEKQVVKERALSSGKFVDVFDEHSEVRSLQLVKYKKCVEKIKYVQVPDIYLEFDEIDYQEVEANGSILIPLNYWRDVECSKQLLKVLGEHYVKERFHNDYVKVMYRKYLLIDASHYNCAYSHPKIIHS